MSKATLKPVISKLREIIIKDISGKMEKYGFDDAGRLINNKPLSEYDSVIKNNLVSLFKGKNIEGNKKEYIAYIQDSARTFLHILICFKTMEQRGLMGNVIGRLMNDHIYDAVIPDFINVPPMAYSDLSEKFNSEISIMEEKDNWEEDREYYNFIFMLSALTKEMAKEVPLLFKDYEHNLVQPDFEGLKEILFNVNKIDADEYGEDDFLGWIYQYWVDIKDDELKTAKGDKDVSYANAIYYEILNNLEEEQTQFGEFYTPRWVVKYIVDNTLKPYFEDNKKIETIKLLDPACGAGNFLVYAFDVFYELYKIEHPDWPDNHIIGNILEKNIFGVDIQREPLQITAINLWLKAKKKAQDVKIKNLNLFNMNILKANSLYRWENEQEEVLQLSLFQDEIEFTEKQYTAEDIGQYITSQTHFAKKEAKHFFENRFDVIVMNPPYLDTYKMNIENRNYLNKNYNFTQNLFSVFAERSFELLKSNGVLGLISSDSFLCTHTYVSFREFLIKNLIKTIIRLGDDVFDGPKVSSTIMIISKSRTSIKNLINYKMIENDYLKNDYLNNGNYIKYLQKNFEKIQGTPFNCEVTDGFLKLFLEKDLTKLNTYVGMKLSNKKQYLLYKWEIPKNILSSFKPYIYKIGNEKWVTDSLFYIKWDKESLDYYDNVKGHRNRDKYYQAGINYTLVSGNEPSFRVMDEGYVFDGNNPVILEIGEPLYFVAFLNSSLSKYLLQLLNFTHVKELYDIKRIPIKNIENQNKSYIINIVKIIIENKQKIMGFNPNSNFFIEIEIEYGLSNGGKGIRDSYEIYREKVINLEEEIKQLEKNIDKFFYDLYKVNDIEIGICEEFANRSKYQSSLIDLRYATVKFLREIVKRIMIADKPKLYTDIEIESKIVQYLEDRFYEGYQIKNEIESIIGISIIDFVKSGISTSNNNIYLSGKGSKDIEEPLLQQRILSGNGINKNVVFWHLSHFLLDFEEDKKYVMQNEIRRLSNEVYRPRLQTVKDKLQGSIAGAEKKELEKQEKLLSEAVKTLEAWKVI